MDSKIFGEVIKQRRLQTGDSQRELAERVGISESTLGAIERGERRLSNENFVKLCLGLGMTVGEMFQEGSQAQLGALEEIEKRMLGEKGQQAVRADATSRLSLEQLGELFESWTAQGKELWLSSLTFVSTAAESRARASRPPAPEKTADKPRRARVSRPRRKK